MGGDFPGHYAVRGGRDAVRAPGGAREAHLAGDDAGIHGIAGGGRVPGGFVGRLVAREETVGRAVARSDVGAERAGVAVLRAGADGTSNVWDYAFYASTLLVGANLLVGGLIKFPKKKLKWILGVIIGLFMLDYAIYRLFRV